MGYAINGPGYHIDTCDVDFNCPKCTCPHGEEDWYSKLEKSKKGLVYIKCKGCKTKIGVTVNMMGDVCVWLKEDEFNPLKP